MNRMIKPATLTKPRTIEHIVTGIATSDGAGVKLTRVLTQKLQQRLDPFLMLDNFRSDDPGRLHRRLSRPSAPRIRDGHLHDRRAHAPSRQCRATRACCRTAACSG